MLPQNFRKLLHQHLTSLLHSQKAVVASLFVLILLFISILQFSDTVLEWSVDKYRIIEHNFASTNNIVGRSFERKLCYTAPIDVVYTWVNGSDPWHQKQLELFRNGQLGTISQTKTQGDSNSDAEKDGKFFSGDSSTKTSLKSENIFGKKISRKGNEGEIGDLDDASGPPTPNRGTQCGSSYCVQAKAVLVTPAISMSDLGEVLDDKPVMDITAYNLSEKTLALTEESFNLDELLEERSLLVNDQKFSFHSVHLSKINQKDSQCKSLPLARMLPDLGTDATKENLKGAFPESLRKFIQTVDLYPSKNLAIVYFKSEGTDLNDLREVNTISLDGKETEVAKVCLLEDIQPNSSDNEMRLSRFKDNEELRYSIRSLQKHAGWVRRIYIVTNGQVPHWLNLENSKVQIVTHEEIFVNKSHLPTFSSSAIESHLHRIPGLSEKFLYFNDDVLLGQDVLPEDFFSQSEGYKVHLSWHVPSCADGCPSGWIHDGFCDATCNNQMCNFDGGDCSNKTSSLDLDDDDVFGMKDLQYIGNCHPGCLNSWLADRYCDIVCNHPECGFDAGDCGLEKLIEFPHIRLSETVVVYDAPVGATVLVLNASDIFIGKNLTLLEGTYKQAKGIRTVSVYPQRQVVVVLLFSNATGSTVLGLNYSGENDVVSAFEFTLNFDSSPSMEQQSGDASENENDARVTTKSTWDFSTVSANKKGPFPISELELDIAMQTRENWTIEQLNDMYRSGDLTDFGFERRKAALLGVPMNLSYTRPVAPSTITLKTSTFFQKSEETELRSTSFAGRLSDLDSSTPGESNDLDSSTTTQKWIRRTTAKLLYASAKFAKNAKKYKDAYADSLRHVNRLYNDAFGIAARKVPAHVPHFVDRKVMAELQTKFAPEFDLTSATQVRSGHDMQFAFSYFHYIMNVQEDLQMSEIFDDIDTDHSGTWNEREIYLAAIRSTDESQTDTQLQAYRKKVEFCVNRTDSFGSEETVTDRSSSPQKFEISKKDVLACEDIKTGLLAQLGKRNRFKFRTTIDAEAFTFIRVGSNASVVQKQLVEILRHPKKFLCLNDEVDYTREDSAVVQATVRQFLETLYPVASSFELPSYQRNHFSQIDELRAWKMTFDWFRNGLIFSAVILLLLFVCLLIPRRRRLICRRVRLWMRSRDIDRTLILHT